MEMAKAKVIYHIYKYITILITGFWTSAVPSVISHICKIGSSMLYDTRYNTNGTVEVQKTVIFLLLLHWQFVLWFVNIDIDKCPTKLHNKANSSDSIKVIKINWGRSCWQKDDSFVPQVLTDSPIVVAFFAGCNCNCNCTWAHLTFSYPRIQLQACYQKYFDFCQIH